MKYRQRSTDEQFTVFIQSIVTENNVVSLAERLQVAITGEMDDMLVNNLLLFSQRIFDGSFRRKLHRF